MLYYVYIYIYIYTYICIHILDYIPVNSRRSPETFGGFRPTSWGGRREAVVLDRVSTEVLEGAKGFPSNGGRE